MTTAACPTKCPEREKVETLHEVVMGNGRPEEGLAFRFGHIEKNLKFIGGLVAANIVSVVGVGWWIVSALSARVP